MIKKLRLAVIMLMMFMAVFWRTLQVRSAVLSERTIPIHMVRDV